MILFSSATLYHELTISHTYSYIRKSISQTYKPTIGADFHSKKLEIMEGDELKTVTLQVCLINSAESVLGFLMISIDMGHCWSGTLSKFGSCLLPWSRGLCFSLRHHQPTQFREPDRLEVGLPCQGQPQGPR